MKKSTKIILKKKKHNVHALFWIQLRYGTCGFDDEKIWSVNNANVIEVGIKIQNEFFRLTNCEHGLYNLNKVK